MGNFTACKAFRIKARVKVSDKPSDVKSIGTAARVGAFLMRKQLKRTHIPVKKAAAVKPVLGICLGMQLLMAQSEEFGKHKGFGFIKGKVVRFKGKMKIPHMGWNEMRVIDKKNPVIKGVKDSLVYFVHSYYTVPEDKKDMLCETDYEGVKFASAVSRGNIYGFQFHPEKSGEKMIKIYKNFNKLVENQER